MTQLPNPPNSGQPVPVQGVTGGPGISQGTASIDPTTGALVIHPANNVTQFRKGSSPQSIQVYEYYNSNTDFSRISLNTQPGGPLQVSVETQPAGVIRDLQLGANGNFWTIHGATGELSPAVDGNWNIGDPTHRVGTLYVATPIAGAVRRFAANGIAVTPSTTSTTFADMPDMLINIPSAGVVTDLLITLTATLQGSVVGNTYQMAMALDGTAEVGMQAFSAYTTTGLVSVACSYLITGVANGTHTLKGRWLAQSGTLVNLGVSRNLIAVQYA